MRIVIAALFCAGVLSILPGALAFDVKGTAKIQESETFSGKGNLAGGIGTFEVNSTMSSTAAITFDKTGSTGPADGAFTALNGTRSYRRVDKIAEESCEGGGTNRSTVTETRAFSTVAPGSGARARLTFERIGDPGPSGRLRIFLTVDRLATPGKSRVTTQRTGIAECDVAKPDEASKVSTPDGNANFGERRVLLAELKPPFGNSQTIAVKRALTPAELGRGDGVREGTIEVSLAFSNLPVAKANVTPASVMRADAATFDPTGSTGKIVEAQWRVTPAEDCGWDEGVPGVGPNPIDEIGTSLDVFEGAQLKKTEATMLCGLKTELTVGDKAFWDTAKADVNVTPRPNWTTQVKPDKSPAQMGVRDPRDLITDDSQIGTNISVSCVANGRLKRGCSEYFIGFPDERGRAKPGVVFDLAIVPLTDGAGSGDAVDVQAFNEVRKQLQEQLKQPGLSAEDRAAIQQMLAQIEANAPKPQDNSPDGDGLDYQNVGKPGPFGGHLYVLKPTLEIARVPVVNPSWLPGGANYRNNIGRGVSADTMARFTSCAAKHERLHSEWLRLAMQKKGFKNAGSGAFDPAPDLESLFDYDPERLIERATAVLREAKARIDEASSNSLASESHKFIRARLMADPQCAKGGTIYQADFAKNYTDFASAGMD